MLLPVPRRLPGFQHTRTSPSLHHTPACTTASARAGHRERFRADNVEAIHSNLRPMTASKHMPFRKPAQIGGGVTEFAGLGI